MYCCFNAFKVQRYCIPHVHTLTILFYFMAISRFSFADYFKKPYFCKQNCFFCATLNGK